MASGCRPSSRRRRPLRREREDEVALNLNVPHVSVPQGGKLRILWVAGASLIVLLVGYNSCTTYVKPGEAGIKQIKFGIGKGIEPVVYGTGLHYVGVGETMHRFPLRLQVLELSNSRSEAIGELEGHRVAPGVNIQTSEGYTVQADLTVYKNEAEAKSATAAAAKNKIVAEGAAAVQVELARGEAEVKKLEADADLYRRKKAAEGDLLVKLAEAQGTELENQALRGVGSENMVGLRMAEALKGTQVIVLPTDGEGGMNPLDLRTMLKRFDVKE